MTDAKTSATARRDLNRWLARQPYGALSRLASATKIPKETLSRIAQGRRPPTLKQAVAIDRATSGAASVTGWVV